MGFPKRVSLGKNENLDARIAPSVLLRAFDRFERRAIADDEELEIIYGLRKHAFDC